MSMVFDVVQIVKPGASTSTEPGTWLVETFATEAEAYHYQDRCNACRHHIDNGGGYWYEVQTIDEENADRCVSYGDFVRSRQPKVRPVRFPGYAWSRPEPAKIETEELELAPISGGAPLVVEAEADDEYAPYTLQAIGEAINAPEALGAWETRQIDRDFAQTARVAPYEPTALEEAEYLDLVDHDEILAELDRMAEEAAWQADWDLAERDRECQLLAYETNGWLRAERMVG